MSKRKKKRNKYKYTKEEFYSILCSNCSVCSSNSDNNLFCYSQYKANNKNFIKKVYPSLRTIEWPDKLFVQLTVFCNVFCKNCLNYSTEKKEDNTCTYAQDCFQAFRAQADPVYSDSLSLSGFKEDVIKKNVNKTLNKKAKKNKYVVQPYMTFFCSGDENWKREVKMIHGKNNTGEQDTS